MQTYLEEKIGNPELFTGRRKELTFFLNWIARTKRKISQSMAVLSRRKTGKSALMQRLYNITFHENDSIIPFYFEIKETDKWLGDFAEDFLLTFVCQYLAFKTRHRDYLTIRKPKTFEQASEICRKQGFDYLSDLIRSAQLRYQDGNADTLWDMAREAPRMVAEYTDERIVQMIDEFQFINRFIFWDREKTKPATTLAGSYLHTAEYKSAPLLVSGSWVGWLMDDLNRLLPGRFIKKPMGNMSEDEALEMIFKYSFLEDIPISEETAWLIARLTEGNPFYISALFRSAFEGRDLTTEQGVRKTLEYETLHAEGSINATWMEYIDSAFPRVNEAYAKNIVLYLSAHRDRRVGHRELREKLGIGMSDSELERKLRALFKSDIIEEDSGCYRGVRDSIFDKVFRRNYSEDIHHFVTKEAPDEYKAMFRDMQKKHRTLMGKYGRHKGAFAEFMIIHHLSFHACENSERYMSVIRNLPDDFEFAEYDRVWSFHSPPLHDPEFQVDIFARAKGANYSLIGEVKNRRAKFSVRDAEAFVRKAGELMRLERVSKAVLLVFSVSGFYKNTLDYMRTHGIAWTSDRQWLER